jgi:hypothetical protein
MSEHAYLKPADANKDYWCIFAWKGLLVARALADKTLPTILRYKPKDVKDIVVTPHIKTFIYFCHASSTWDIHELSTGVMLASGGSITDAYKKCCDFFKEANEDMFFKQMQGIGDARKHSMIDYDTAMVYLQAGEAENPHLAKIRRKLNLRGA